MKISFPKYGTVELLTQKRLATCIISFAAIIFLAGVCGSYLLGNKWWLLTIAVLGVAGLLLCLGVAAAIFFNKSELNETSSAITEENEPITSAQWDYRPSKPIRARGVLNSPSTETSDGFSSDSFGINNNIWLNDNSLEGAAPTFIDGPPETEEAITEALPQTADPARTERGFEDVAV